VELPKEETNMSSYLEGSPETIARHYDLDQGPSLFPPFADDLARRVATHLPAHVLETAAGTGFLTRELRNLLPGSVSLTATDLVPMRLDVARPKFQADEQVEFQVADATKLPFPASSYDVVVCQFGVMFFPDKDKSYREVHRVLVGGGHYLFNVWDSHRYNPFGRLLHEAVNPAGLEWTAPFSYHEIDPIKESLLSASFTSISATVVSLETTVPSAAVFARGAVLGSPLAAQLQESPTVAVEAVVDALTSAIRREFGPDPVRMPLQAIVFEARKK
jgi:ubiquinone/menaquinone biosynthesis C-methylase UbiE